ncbi:uncharacterized protein DUF3667 [Winogradskyella wandonensis]|uniref:Uncharacterized protein DUF3667 n=1 Tax=Winogradskyella wandonensis TaxID=1442586 RepID=A0A4R1KXR8_9FLAO|nr:DUF3667 domain-containing protein [Winogradskyella wandonensis]TCK69370.1 uncharacterized protein DUF3667 [Winogradskyella wandonensis]
MSNNPINCQNCEKSIVGEFRFCPNCGQKTNDELTLGVLFYNTISNYLSFDAKFLRSFAPLMFKPGYLAKAFVQGKRSRYLHPGNMYLFVSVIFFFLFSFVINDWSKDADELNKRIAEADVVENSESQRKRDSINNIKVLNALKRNQNLIGMSDEELARTDSIMRSQKLGGIKTSWGFNKSKVDSLVNVGAPEDVIYKEMGMSEDAGYFERQIYKGSLNIAKGSGFGKIIKRMFDAVPVAMFILLPLFALLLKLFYFRRGRYSYHLVFSFYFFSFLFTVFAMLLGIGRIFPAFPAWISWLIVFSTFLYFYLALFHFYQRHWFTTLLKSGVITFIFLLTIIPTAFGILFVFGLANA